MTRQIRTMARCHGQWVLACGLALGLLMTASCSKAQLMAPTGSTLTLLVNRATVGLNTSVTITALVSESSGTPVQNGTVVAFFTTLGTLSAAQATTTNGQATVQLLTGGASGVAEITATSGSAKASATSVKVTIGAAGVGRVELTASPTSLPAVGGTTVLTATVSDVNGNRLSGIPVTFSSDVGNIDQSGATTDSNGQVQAQLTTHARTNVTASVAGGTSGSVKSDPVVITVRTGPNAALTATVAAFQANFLYSAFPGVDGTAIVSVSLTFGDGTFQGSLSPGSDQSWVHVYTTLGTFIARVTVTDAAGETSTASATVLVAR